MPIEWDELDDPGLRPDGWTTATAPARVADVGDPWAGIARHARALGSRAPRLDALLSEAPALD
jgi:bifunctional non-homologous end joining protein LigD